jgi:hypothetical protein
MNPWVRALNAYSTRHWPGYTSPFLSHLEVRPIRVFVEGDLIADCDASQLIAALASHPKVEVLDPSGRYGHPVELAAIDDRRDDWVATMERGTTVSRTLVNSTSLRALADRMVQSNRVDAGCSATTCFNGLMRQRAAESLKSDIFVTHRSYLLESDSTRSCVSLGLDDAVALVGSYLRRQGDYRIRPFDPNSIRLFDRILVHVLLPRRDQWQSLVDRERERLDEYSLNPGFCDGVVSRLGQAVRARDWMHWALLSGQDSDDEALLCLDMFLLTLHAAFDATALLADRAVGLETSDLRRIGWTRTGWRKRLPGDIRELLDLPDLQFVFKLLSALRNTVHGPSLGAVGLSKTHFTVETVVTIPQERNVGINQWLESVGVKPVSLVPDEVAVRPAELVEWMLPAAADVIDRLLVACARNCVWAPPAVVPPPWRFDRWDEVRLLGGVRPNAGT